MTKPGPLWVAVFLAACASRAGAQEIVPEYFKATTVDGETVFYARGLQIPPFRMYMGPWEDRELKEFALRADRAIIWTGPDAAGIGANPLTGARRIYAEGNVVLVRRDVKSGEMEIFRAGQIYLDLEKRTGYFSDIRIDHKPGEDLQTPVTLRAKEAKLAAGGIDPAAEAFRTRALGLPGISPPPPGRLTAFDVILSTCTFGDPHYSVGLASAKVDWRFPTGDENAFGSLLGKPEDPVIGGDWVTFNMWGVPVFTWPSFSVRLAALTALPLERLQGGKTDRFGWTVESTWGFKLSKGFVDSLVPFGVDDPTDDKKPWGRLRFEADYREKRGWAAGLDPSWKWDAYHGYIDSYYLRDKGPDPDNDFDARFLPLERTDRGRVRGFHRQELTPLFRIEFEFSWLSDRNVLEEFFEKEFKEGKEQETVGYLRYLDGHHGGFLQEKVRINDFQTQLEYLPRAKYFLTDEPLVPALPLGWTFSEELEVVNQRMRFDEDLGLEDPRTWRLDSLSSWDFTVPLGVATLSPFIDARITAWEEALDGDPADRFLATAGARLAMDIHGDHDVKSELLGLHNLRHIIHLEARGVSAFVNTLEPGELFQYDPVDGLDVFQELSFEIRNVFQTKVIDGQEFRKRDVLEIGAEIEFYPRAERDTVGFKASNFSSPFNYITLAPHDATKVLDERDWSNIHWDLLFRPSNYLEARGLGEYNPVHRQEEVREYTVTVRPQEGLALSVGQVFVFDVTNAFSVGVRWDLTEKWRVTADTQFDFKTDEFTNRRLTVSRSVHDFRFEAVYEEDVGRDERRFYVTFAPTFLKTAR